MLLEWARASWAHVYATSTSLEWFLWSWVVLVALYWLLGAAYLVLDVTHWPAFLYRHKLQPARPFIIGGSQHNPPLKSLIINSLIIHFAIFLPGAYGLHLLFERGWMYATAELPRWTEVLGHMGAFVVVEEIGFFYSHLLFHQGRLYQMFHKKHHTFRAPIALAATYAHPLETILNNALPLIAGPLLCRSHVVTYWLWLVVAIVGTMHHHSGYRFPWDPAFDHNPDFHDYHHEIFNCNYGLLGWLDRLHGTYVSKKQHKQPPPPSSKAASSKQQ